MPRWEIANNILKVVILTFLTLVPVEIALAYYDFINISLNVVRWEFTFGCILLSVSINFYSYFIRRKVSEFLMIESIKKRPFKELYTYRQIAIWNDISSNILQEGKKYVPFGFGFRRSVSSLEGTFVDNIMYIRRRLNTKYKGMDEDIIDGKDAILIAAKKTYDEDLKQYYNENVFNKNNNWKKYGTTIPSDPVTETTKLEKSRKLYWRIKLVMTLFLVVYGISIKLAS